MASSIRALGLHVTPGAAGAFVEERRDELIEFACELVATPSPSPPGSERAVAALVIDRLRELGIGDVSVFAKEPERPNVIARVSGRGAGPTLILNGHLDTKPPGALSAWATPPWTPRVENGTLTGLGSADMKGAAAAMVYAAAAVGATAAGGTLVLALTADEEAGGVYGVKWLAEEGLLEADACVIGEPCGIHRDWEAIRLVSRGAAIFTIRVRGTQMHSSLSDQLESVNASVLMARLMARLDREGSGILTYPPHPLVELGPTLNVGLTVSGGVGYGILCGEAEFLSDIRALPGMSKEQIEADLRSFLRRAMAEEPGLDAELVFDHWTPPSEIEAGHPIVEALEDAAENVLGARVPLGAFPGGTDAPFFQLGAGIPTVPSFGPGLLTVAHAPNEAISVESIVQAAKIYAVAAGTYLGG
jgi:acetylornithine deacetylase